MVAAVTVGLLLTACGSGPLPSNLAAKEGHQVEHASSASPSASESLPQTPLRAGEHFVELKTPADYRPTPKAGSTDDYRCFLLDPGLTEPELVSGVNIIPGNPNIVHHVIVSQVPASQVARAQALDAADAGDGWTCFGGTGIGGVGGRNLDKSDWVGAWAPGGGERVMSEDVGILLEAGTQVVVQMHFNTLTGGGADTSLVRLRLSPAAGSAKKALNTMLLPAPVELPCRLGHTESPLCDRAAAIDDVKTRFGETVATADLLHVLCGGDPIGDTQQCTRSVREPMVIRAAAGHMHLLGRSITIDVDKGTPQAKRILDVPVYDFDDQGSRALSEPVTLQKGQTLTVTCTHDQSLRDQLPAFQGTPERYVVWGEGTTDEMCLGIVLWHAP